MSRIRQWLSKEEGSRKKFWALIAAYALFAMQLVFSTGVRSAQAAVPPTFRAAATATGSGGASLVINVPTGTVLNDLMLTQITLDSGGASVTPPAGWIYLRDDGNGGIRQYVYYRVATASEPASYTWGISAGISSGATASFVGVDPFIPIHAHSGQAVPGSGTITAPSLNTTLSDVTLVGLFGHDDGLAIDPPPSMIERWDVASTETTTQGSSEVFSSPGATGSRVATTAGGSNDNVGQLVALTPAGGVISGFVFEDIAGNLLGGGEAIGDVLNPGRSNVPVYVYEDDGDGIPESGEIAVGSTTTAASGAYLFTGLDPAKDYWVFVDSAGVSASAGYNPTYTAASARPEQTYGPRGSWCADASAWGTTVQGTAAEGACFGGRRVSFVPGSQSDDISSWWSGAEHLSYIDLDAGLRDDVNFGFSFNVVASNQGNTAGSAEQGSFDQFLQNANAVAGPNPMRFVPAGPTNAAAAGANWWLISPTAALTEINDADTTVDGAAFNFDGTTRNDNPLAVGTGGTVGVDAIAFAQVPGSELQIDGQGLVIIDDAAAGLVPHRATIRALSITEAGAQAIRVNAISQVAPVADDVVLEELIIGMPPVWQPQTLPTGTDVGIHLNAVNRASVQDSFVGWINGRTLNVETSTDAVIRGNEFRDTSEDVIDIYEGSTGTLFEQNRVSGGLNWGLDITVSSNTTLRNNTVDSAGDGVGQTGAVRLFGPGSIIDRNVFSNNAGPAIAIAGTMTSPARAAGEAVITRNHFLNNDGLGIDLQAASEDNSISGDGITPNNGGATDLSHGNHEIDFPVITAAGLTGGTTTVQGTACAGCTIEIYKAVGGTGDDDPPGSGTNYHGEGVEYLGSGVAPGGAFSIDVTGLVVGDSVSATATDTGAGVTSEFAQNLAVVAWSSISGRLFEDLAADALAGAQAIGDAANPVVAGVDVYLYADDGTTPGSPDGSDSILNGGAPVATDGTGAFSFASLPNGTYWVVADSATMSPGAGLEPTFAVDDVWAEQTYGPAGAWCADGTGGTGEAGAAGTCYGGRSGTASDQAAALTSAEHLARVVIAGGSPVADVDFGFSYDVVTSTRGGGATVDPGAAGTQTVQGSLRQFIANASNITGANQMRFVPAAPTNGTDGTNNWWRVAVTSSLPAITNAFTSIDGTAYQLADGITVRDDNNADQGAGETVGVDGLYTTPVLDPELELDITGPTNGLLIEAADTTVRGIGIWGSDLHDIAVGDDLGPTFTGVLIEQNIVGTPPHRFDGSFAPSGNDLIELFAEATDGIVRDNLIGFNDGGGVSVDETTGGWLVVQNEIRGTGRAAGWGAVQDAVGDAGPGTIVRGNLLVDNAGMGVDSHLSPGGFTIEQNTIRNNGTIAPENAGIRVIGSGSTVTKNLFEQNNGPAIIVVSDDATAPYPGANGNRISQNHFSNSTATADNAGIAVDLLDAASPSAEHDAGDGITLNDGSTDPDAGNLGLDYPVITNAFISGGSLVVTGWARPGVEIEFYEAVGTANDQNGAGTAHGEGFSYLFTGIEGSGADTDPATGSYADPDYGSDAAAAAFSFSVPLPASVSAGDEVSAAAIDGANNTSEFGPNSAAFVAQEISGKVFEDIAGDVLADGVINDANNPGLGGVTVRLYRDTGNGVPDGSDIQVATTTTDSTPGATLGDYLFPLLSSGTYFVAVDSTSAAPSAGVNASPADDDDVWAEQTYGPIGSYDGLAFTGAAGAFFGGKDGATADDPSALLSSEHVARAVLAGAGVGSVDFGLSFNVVTNIAAGDGTDADLSADRVFQGSYRQFLLNANAVAGPNAMRFVPTVPTNGTDGAGNDWWRIDVTAALPVLTDANTTIDGRPYMPDGVSGRNDNGAAIGTGGVVGLGGIYSTPTLDPELEIRGDDVVGTGIELAATADGSTIRNVAVARFNFESVELSGLLADPIDGITIETSVFGAKSPADFTFDAAAPVSSGVTADYLTNGTVRSNLFRVTNQAMHLEYASTDNLVQANETRGANTGIYLKGSATDQPARTTIRGNAFMESGWWGVRMYQNVGDHTVEENTISLGGNYGIELSGTTHTVSGNIVTSNGAEAIRGSAPLIDADITQNEFGGNGELAIDLGGDGITLNDDGDIDAGPNAAINYPIVTSAYLLGGNLIVSGYARAGDQIEFYESVGAANDNNASAVPHGEGVDYLFTATEGVSDGDSSPASYTDPGYGTDTTAEGFSFTVPAPVGLALGERVSAIAYQGGIGSSEFGPSVTVTIPPGSVSGTVFEDIAGNVLNGPEAVGDPSNPVVPGAAVRVYEDTNGNNIPDAGDTLIAGPVFTDAGGNYSVGSLFNGVRYWVTVDSTTVAPDAGVHPSYSATTPWAEQTYGPDDALCADGLGGSAYRVGAGPCYGGRVAGTVDGAGALATAQHVARVVPSGAETGLDFGFSFNVVTHTQAAFGPTLDAASAQGSLDQFVRNANSIPAANAMRFVPAVPANGGAGQWWRIDYTGTAIGDQVENVHDADTTVDGTAFSLTDGSTVVNSNAGFLGANAAGGVTVGVDDVALPQVARPELELVRTDGGTGVGFNFYHWTPSAQTPHNFTVRDLAISGFAHGISSSGIAAGRPTGVTIERVVVGSGPDTFTDPGYGGTLGGVSIIQADDGFIRNNVLGFFENNAIVVSGSDGWTISGNEVREAAQIDSISDGINHGGSTTNGLISANLVVDSGGMGIDGTMSGTTITNNTITGSGVLGVQTGGIRFNDGPNDASRNVLTGNAGPGIIITDSAQFATMAENRFGGNGGPAIDLVAAGGDTSAGDGITLNDGTLLGDSSVANQCGIVAGDANDGLDSPVITSADWALGTTTITGLACPGSTVQVYEALAGAGDTLSGTDYGEGILDELTQVGPAVVADGAGNWTFATNALSVGDDISALSTDPSGNTSEFGANSTVTTTIAITGTIFEDRAGDALAGLQTIGDAANPFESGVRIELFRDGGDGIPDGGDDTYIGFTVSALADGTYSFSGLPPDVYWVTVDSQGVFDGPINAGYAASDAWAEQTYGPAGAASYDGSTWTFDAAAGPHYGGARWDVSDDFAPTASLPGADHIARADLTGGPIADMDFGFSFNVVTTTRGATTAQDPGAGAGLRTVQGSLRQFLTNANAQSDANAMRFVPAAPINDGSWWEILVSDPLPAIEDVQTTVVGTAYDAADGVTVRDTTPGYLGANAAGGLTVGTDGLVLPQVERPELEIQGDQSAPLPPQLGLEILASSVTVRRLAIYGFGDIGTAGLDSDIRVGPSVTPLEGIVLDSLVIGSAPGAFADPGPIVRSQGTGIRITDAVSGGGLLDNVITDSLIGHNRSTGVLVNSDTGGWIVSGNEIRATGTNPSSGRPDGLSVEGTGSTSHVITGNLIVDASRVGIETWRSGGGHSIVNNDIISSSTGYSDETAGVRLAGPGNLVSKNRINGGTGPGIVVIGENTASPHVASINNLISQNEFGSNTGLAIDLVAATTVSAPHSTGDGLTLTPGTDPGTGNIGVDAPVITSASTTSVSGTACVGCTVEVYRAVSGAGDGGYGEGVEYVGSAVVGGGGTFTAAVAGVGTDDEVSAITIDPANNTSEFGANLAVNSAPVLDPVGDRTVDELTALGFTATASDPDSGDTLTFSLSGAPAGASITPGGVFSWTPTEAQGPGSYVFDVVVTDDATPAGSDSETITVTVDEVNVAPVLDPVGNQSVDEQTALGFTATASDPDLPANGLTFSLSGAPVGASITPGGVFSWTPTEAQGPGSYVFDVIVTDDGTPALADSETITVTVNEVNVAPVLDPVGDQSVDEQTALGFTATASDPDVPANGLTFSLSGAPVGASITPGGVFSWTPTEAQGPGSYVFDVIVTDDGTPALADSETITVTVNEVNLAPTIVGPGDQTNAEAELVSVAVAGSDPDLPDAGLTYSATGLPPGITMNPVTGVMSGAASYSAAGSYPVTVRATDGGGLFDEDSFTWTISDSGTALIINKTASPAGAVLPGDPIEYTIVVTNVDSITHTNLTITDALPSGATWVSTDITTPAPHDVLDTFTVASYTNDDGADAWAGPWIEVADVPNGSPLTGELYIHDTGASGTNLALDVSGPSRSIERSVDLTGALWAELSFNYTPYHIEHDLEEVYLDVWDGSSWVRLETFTLIPKEDKDATTWTANITPHVNADTRVRFSTSAELTDSEGMFVDDVRVAWTVAGTPVAGGVGPTHVSGLSLHPGEAVTVVYSVTVDDPPSVSSVDNVAQVTSDQHPAALSAATSNAVSNRPPVADPVGDQSVDETTLLSLTATGSDPDLDALTWTLDSGPGSVLPNGDYSWTPGEADGPGTYTVVLRVTDDGTPALSDTVSFDVTVNEVNVAPVLDPVGDQSVDEQTALGFTATASDPDLPANGLTFSLSGAPVGASITPGGVFSWTPTEAQGPGSYVFDVVVTDDGTPALADSETITVTVNEVNVAPVLDPVGDQSVDEQTALGFTATASDPDVPANGLTFSLSGAPVGASITPGGVFSWTPTEAQGPGSYVFDVIVTDDGTPALADSETITVTVNEVNVAPSADVIADQVVDENTLLVLTATASDPDLPANSLTWTQDSGPGSLLPNGDYSWTPGEADGPGTYTVVLRVTDDGAGALSDTVSFDVTVNEVNLAPVLDPVGDRSVDEQTSLGFTATATDPDTPANGLTFSLSGAPAGASITPGGVFSWTPTEAQGPGSYVFDVVVTETDGSPSNLSDSETITVTVNEVNVAPVLGFIGNRAVDELDTLSFTAMASDADLPANGLTFSLSGAPVGASITPGGVFSWTPTEAQGPGSYVFDVVVTDDGTPSLNDSETITVTVGEENLPPVLNPIGDRSTNELSTLTFTATASDPDAPVNTLLFSLVGQPAGATIDPNTGDFSWTPTEAQGPGAYTFDVVVTDDGTPALNDSETITVTVNEINVAPVLDPVGDRGVDEQTALGFTATASDADLPANGLTFSLSGAPAGASITAGGVFSWTPTEAQGPGSYVFDVIVTDDGTPALADSETITVTVNEVNIAPTLTSPGDQTNAESDVVSVFAPATDPDLPANGLTWSAIGLPAGLSIAPATGEIVGTIDPLAASGSPYAVTITVTDDGSPVENDSVAITWTVTDTNRPPVLDPVGDRVVDEQATLAFTATASDPDFDPYSFSLSGAPAGASITPGGSFSWTPTEAQGPGSYTFDVIVSDGGAPVLTDTETITVTVNEVNLPPVPNPIPDYTFSEYTTLNLTASASDPDDPANTVTWSIVSGPAGATLTPAGDFSWTADETHGGSTYTFTLRATDDGVPAASGDVSFDVTVTEDNQPPSALPIADVTIDEQVTFSFTAAATDADIPANNLTWSLSSGPGFILPNGDYSWNPGEADGPGSYVVILRVTDDGSGNLWDEEAFTITVDEVNTPPNPDPIADRTLDELDTVTVNATATDSDVPANSLSWALDSGPGAVTPGGVYSWTPTEADGPGTYPVTLRVIDDGTPSLSTPVTFDVIVDEINNNVPVAVDDAYGATLEGGTRVVPAASGVLVNDTDGDIPADPLSATLVADVSYGVLALAADGSFTYTHDGSENHTDTFTYQVFDGANTSLPATVTLTMIPVSDQAPVAVDDSYGPVAEGATLAVPPAGVLDNDFDGDVPAEPLTATLRVAPAHGAVTLNADGSFSYVHDGTENFTDTFEYEVSDGIYTDTGTVTITIDPVNDNPPVAFDRSYVLDEGATLAPDAAAGVLGSASDADGDPLTATLGSAPVHGTLAMLADGSFTYVHDGSENYLDGFTFTVGDGVHTVGPLSVFLSINPVNDVPNIDPAAFSVLEDAPVGTALGTPPATDGDGDPLVYSFATPAAEFSIDSLTGEISTAAALDFETVASYTIAVTVTDPSGASDTADTAIIVLDVDEPPVGVPAAFPIVEDLPVGSTVGVVVGSDPEGEPVTFTLVGGDPTGRFTIDPVSGELILVAPLNADTTPSYVLAVDVSDPGGNIAPVAVIVIVNAVLDLPPINAAPLGLPDQFDLFEDSSVVISPLLNDSDPDGDLLLVSWIDSPANGKLVPRGDGTFTYRPDPNFFGTETLSYGISDGRGGAGTGTVVLVISPLNDAPITPDVFVSLEFAPELLIPTPAIFDPDGDAISIVLGVPEVGAVELVDGAFLYRPQREWNGTDSFTYTVTDSRGATSSGLVTVSVVQLDGDLVAIDLVTVEPLPEPEPQRGNGIIVDSIKLLVGTVTEMAGLLTVPVLAVGIAFLSSILFGLSRNFLIGRGPVFLPATAPGSVAIVRVPEGGVITALDGPGEEYPLVHRYEPAERGIRSTGRRAQRGSTLWVEVETPSGDAWVIERLTTREIPPGEFAADEAVAAMIADLSDRIEARGDLSPIVSKYGLEVAYYAPPKHIGDDELKSLLKGEESWGWWDPTGSTPSVRGEFVNMVADPLRRALEGYDGLPVAEAVVPIPVELINFPHLTFSAPDKLGWRIFVDYDGDTPQLAAIWREGVTNPSSI